MGNNKIWQNTVVVLILLFSFVFLGTVGYAQSYINENRDVLNYTLAKNESLNVDGSPYLNNEWKKGTLIFSSGKKLAIDLLNYNVYQGVVSYKVENLEYNPDMNAQIIGLTIAGRHFILEQLDKGRGKEIYEVLSDGTIQLLKKYFVSIRKGKVANGLEKATKDHFNLETFLFYKRHDGEIKRLVNGKNALTILEGQESKVKKFKLDNKLKLKRERDLIEIFDYYNSIVN